MGSRGSSSGKAGPHGKGMLGRRSGTTVKSSHYLTDEIGEGGTGFVDEVMRTRDNLEKVYGDAVRDVNLQAATFSNGSAMGAYGGNTLYMAEKYIKNVNLTEAMQNCAESGFHPSIGTFTGAEAVTAHELGHRVGEVAAAKLGTTQEKIVGAAAKKIGLKASDMAGYISGYARTNYAETIAEACADVYCNGNKAAKQSIAIMNEVKTALNS